MACSTRKLCDKNDCLVCYNRSFASHTRNQFWSSDNKMSPRQVFKNSNKSYKFDCRCGHSFESRLSSISSNDRWCPYCANQKLCDKDCQECFNKSFASHEKSRFWSNDNKISSRQVLKNSNKSYKFDCTCGHKFESKLSSISSNNTWCAYCANQQLCDNTDCQVCYNKSFASHEKSQFWSNDNEERPRHIFKGSSKKYKFNCTCTHTFEASLDNVVGKERWCPYCCDPPKKLCGKEDCQECFNKSFASHKKSQYWSKANKIAPNLVFKNSNKKYKFICEHEHEFEADLGHVSNDRWCPYCKYKTEQIIFEFLTCIYPQYKILRQTKYDWCIWKETGRKCKYDFVIVELNLIIEVDGPQHFKQIAKWKDAEVTRQKDIFKMEKANANAYTVIRILQNDVFYNHTDWKTDLKKHIKKYDIPSRIFICRDNEYDQHKSIV